MMANLKKSSKTLQSPGMSTVRKFTMGFSYLRSGIRDLAGSSPGSARFLDDILFRLIMESSRRFSRDLTPKCYNIYRGF